MCVCIWYSVAGAVPLQELLLFTVTCVDGGALLVECSVYNRAYIPSVVCWSDTSQTRTQVCFVRHHDERL